MQHLKELYLFLKENEKIKKFLEKAQSMSESFLASPEEFAVSDKMKIISDELRNLELEKLEEIVEKLPIAPHITAIIMKACHEFTVAFILIPPKSAFSWHDHRSMSGISRCVSGNLTVSSLNPDFLESVVKVEEEISESQEKNQEIIYYEYPIDLIRKEMLDPREQNISIIYPDTYNIHEIQSREKQSAFIDFLIPEYPENSCTYYETIKPTGQGQECGKQKLMLKKSKQAKEKVIGLQQLLKIFKQQGITNPPKI